ncbi:hypothetical protein CPB86DRAFT_771456 [Serendipita vermifera]|nr:hypothetical protein CPB86DRAFT_771456 [Serendipita vermifera]
MKFPNVDAANAIYRYHLALRSGLNVPKRIQDQLWNIYAINMRAVMPDMEMDRLEKESEWFHPHSRLLILNEPTDESQKSSRTSQVSGSVVAYGIFRFDTEENEKDDEMDEVLYCYELQVSTKARRLGLGKKLLSFMEMFGTQYNMKKLILTCHKANSPAIAFYMSMGLINDPICPSKWMAEGDLDDEEEDEEEEEIDYYILSKPLAKEEVSI